MPTVRQQAGADSTARTGGARIRRAVLRARARALEPILQTISDGIVVADRQGVFLFFNEAAERILGRGLLEVTPAQWTEAYGLFRSDRVTPFPAPELPLVCAIRGEVRRDVEIFVRHADRPDGAVISVTAMPWRDPSGDLLGGVAVFRDVTAHRHADAAVRRLSNAVEQAADAIYITDRDGLIEYVNPGFEQITGYTRDEAIGQTPRLLRSGHHDAGHYQDLWKTLLDGRVFHGTMVNRRRNGEIYYAEMTITPILDPAGAVTHFVAVGKDMTDRRVRQEQEMELALARSVQQGLFPARAPRFRGFDIAGVAHPAATMCGDYYDFVVVGDHRLCMAIGDVSGHGLGPALLMAETRAYLRAYLSTLPGVAEVLRALNRTLAADLEDGRFVSMLLAGLDVRGRTLTYANAGHPPGLVLASDGRLRATLESTGTPLGSFPELGVGDARPVALEPGDVVVLMTDGITESSAPDGSLLGTEGVLRTVRSRLGGTAREVLDGLVEGVREFARDRGQDDDLAAIVCRVDPA